MVRRRARYMRAIGAFLAAHYIPVSNDKATP
jgi:hypothetical protein